MPIETCNNPANPEQPKAVAIDLDLETMGVKGHNPAILQIGAVATDAQGKDVGGFNMHVDLSSTEGTASIDSATILWWLEQSEEARKPLLDGQKGAPHINNVLCHFAKWYGQMTHGGYDATVWGYGSLSDVLWLRSAYDAAGLQAPWWQNGRGYRLERCLRTLHDEIGLPWHEFIGTKHSAFDDAVNQSIQRVRLQKWIAEAHELMARRGMEVPEQLG